MNEIHGLHRDALHCVMLYRLFSHESQFGGTQEVEVSIGMGEALCRCRWYF